MRAAVALLSVVLFVTALGQAQTPVAGPNVNMVSGTQWPGGDPFLQRQNESSLAVSTRNAEHLLAGANDYRSVDIPFPPDSGIETGDAWVGVFKSTDAGDTWRSNLMPGYPQDTSAVGMASPLKAFSVATDPTVRAGTHGLFYYSGLVFNRTTNASAVFIARFQDQNNKGNGDPIAYISASVIDNGTSGQFLDKPWIAVDVPRPGTAVGAATCKLNGQTFSSGNVYLVYSVFLGTKPANNPHTQIRLVRSTDCGATWSKPIKLSESYTLNQGTVAAVDPGTGALHVAWRQLAANGQPDALLYAVSYDGGKTFSKATQPFSFAARVLFDQNSSSTAFRTIALPSLAVDGSGRVYMAWSQRNTGAAYNSARILMSTLPRGGTTWSAPFMADPGNGPGHQFLPALSFAWGKLMLAYYDLRDDQTLGVLRCPAGNTCNGVGDFVEVRLPQGDLADGHPEKVFTDVVSDAGLRRRHTMDVRGASADPSTYNAGANPPIAFTGFKISQYKFGTRKTGGDTSRIEQLQFNPPNFPLFVKGTRAFIGDYIDLAALSFVVGPSGAWVHNTTKSSAAVFHATWTDNRDVRPPPVVCDAANVCKQNWSLYTPVSSIGGTSLYDSTQTRPACVPDQTGSRNENVYSSRITEGLVVGFRENTKQFVVVNGQAPTRAFSLVVRNNTSRTTYYRLSIQSPLPAGTQATFEQGQVRPVLDVAIGPRSSVARFVFVTSTLKSPVVNVTVKEISGIGGVETGGLQSAAITNPDITNPDIINPDIINPDITNPDITNPDITNPDIRSAEVYNPTITNPDIINPDITNPDITNPDITNPDIINPDITNPDIANPDITELAVINPDITNPDITNPDITNPDIINPDIINPDISSFPTGVTDFTWKLTNKGNTTASYNAKLLAQNNFCCPAGCPGGNGCPASCYRCQLVLRRTYPTPLANGCQLTVETQNVPVSNIPNPNFADPATVHDADVSSDASNATIALGPGQAGRITLRVFGLETTSLPAGALNPAGVALGHNTADIPDAASLLITTQDLPLAFVGKPYYVQLLSIGGVGPTRTWSIFQGALPGGLLLDPATGVIAGMPTGTGASSFVVQVQDSPTVPSQTQVNRKTLSIDVNGLSITRIEAYKQGSPGSTVLKGGDTATVEVEVATAGTATAGNVAPSALTVSGTGASASCTGPSPASANLNGGVSQVFQFTCSVNGDGNVSFSTRASASYSGGVTLQTATAVSNTVLVDSTAPQLSVTAISGGAPYVAGTWSTQPVQVTFACTDAGSGVAAGDPTGSATLTADTPAGGTTLNGACHDAAGNEANLSFGPVLIDSTPPTITATQSPLPNANGWNNTPVTVTFTCTDGGASGFTPPPPVTLSLDGANQSAAGVCSDTAGNSTSYAVNGINIDRLAPQLTVAATSGGAPYVAGTWSTKPVQVTFSCTDAGSGVAAGDPTGSATLTADTPAGGTTLSGACHDAAGNDASLAFGPVLIDSTPPTISATRSPLPNANGWNNTPVTVTFTCTDGGASGFTPPPPVTLSFDGANQSATGVCSDTAGNSTSYSVNGISIDRSAPTVTITSPTTGTYTPGSSVTLTYACADALSGIDSCIGPAASGSIITVAKGTTTLTVTATDRAGNTASSSVQLTGKLFFTGFLSPLVAAGTYGAPTFAGTFNLGKAIPLKWQLKDANGALIADLSSLTLLTAVPNPACAGAPPAGAVPFILFNPTNGATGGSTFRYDTGGGIYIFNWDTSSVGLGCYNVVVQLADDSVYATIVKFN